MASAAFFLAPLLVLAASWYLLNGLTAGSTDRRRDLRLAAGCLAGALALTLLGIVADDQSPAPARPGSSTGADV